MEGRKANGKPGTRDPGQRNPTQETGSRIVAPGGALSTVVRTGKEERGPRDLITEGTRQRRPGVSGPTVQFGVSP